MYSTNGEVVSWLSDMAGVEASREVVASGEGMISREVVVASGEVGGASAAASSSDVLEGECILKLSPSFSMSSIMLCSSAYDGSSNRLLKSIFFVSDGLVWSPLTTTGTEGDDSVGAAAGGVVSRSELAFPFPTLVAVSSDDSTVRPIDSYCNYTKIIDNKISNTF